MIETFIPAIVFTPMGSVEITRLLIVVILLLMSALLSGSETAFFSLSPQQINHLESHHSRTGKAALRLLSIPDYLLATILIANNLVNICVVIVSNNIINACIDFQGATTAEFVVKMLVVAFLLLLFGEIMPKIFATYNALRVARFMAYPLLLLKSLFKPISFLLIHSSNHINETMAKKKVSISIDELSNAIEITSNQSVEEKKILSGIVDFVHTEVVEIMRPRVDMVALDVEEDFTRVKEVIIASGFSRIPVYEENLDHIKGVIYVKDLLPHISNNADFEWSNLCRKPYFVPEHKKINDLLEEFQTQKIHVAIVVDEYGSTMGLASLEDILEEIVGEISDESDRTHEFYTKLDTNTYLFDGKTHLNDLLKVVKLEDDYLDLAKGEAETIAGLMLETRKDFLTQGDVITCKELTLRAEKVNGHRIEKIKVNYKPEQE